MARDITLKATLNFNFADQAEMTATRTKAINFANANNGKYAIVTSEDPENSEMSYYGKIFLTFNVASNEDAYAIKTTLDNALPTLPDLVYVDGEKLRYLLDEKEI